MHINCFCHVGDKENKKETLAHLQTFCLLRNHLIFFVTHRIAREFCRVKFGVHSKNKMIVNKMRDNTH